MKLVYSTVLVFTALSGLTHYYVDTWDELIGPQVPKVAAADSIERPAAQLGAARLP